MPLSDRTINGVAVPPGLRRISMEVETQDDRLSFVAYYVPGDPLVLAHTLDRAIESVRRELDEKGAI